MCTRVGRGCWGGETGERSVGEKKVCRLCNTLLKIKPTRLSVNSPRRESSPSVVFLLTLCLSQRVIFGDLLSALSSFYYYAPHPPHPLSPPLSKFLSLSFVLSNVSWPSADGNKCAGMRARAWKPRWDGTGWPLKQRRCWRLIGR